MNVILPLFLNPTSANLDPKMTTLQHSPRFGLGDLDITKPHFQIAAAAAIVFLFVASIVVVHVFKPKVNSDSGFLSYCKFFYSCFLKPHERGDETGQQYALESFYKTQVCVILATKI